MRSFTPEEVDRRELHNILLSGVAPRPIALVGTQSSEGIDNLAPFSFFNAFSSNPPVVAFSPAYRGTDGTAKDSFSNLKATGECTISVVSYAMVEQTSLSSSLYPPEIDEFAKAGFTKLPSKTIAPPGVAESPFVMECTLLHHYEVARGRKGSGNIMICAVQQFHVSESAFDGDRIDPRRIDLVARMGFNWYTRAGSGVFDVPKPAWNGIGFDALPDHIKTSVTLTGNDLALLASVQSLPTARKDFLESLECQQSASVDVELRCGAPERALFALMNGADQHPRSEQENISLLHKIAAAFLRKNDIDNAWQTLLLTPSDTL